MILPQKNPSIRDITFLVGGGSVSRSNGGSFNFGYIPAGGTSKTIIIYLGVSGVTQINNIKIFIKSTGNISFNNAVFRVDQLDYIDNSYVPKKVFTGVNVNADKNSIYNFTIDNANALRSKFVYLNVSLANNQNVVETMITYNWIFNYDTSVVEEELDDNINPEDDTLNTSGYPYGSLKVLNSTLNIPASQSTKRPRLPTLYPPPISFIVQNKKDKDGNYLEDDFILQTSRGDKSNEIYYSSAFSLTKDAVTISIQSAEINDDKYSYEIVWAIENVDGVNETKTYALKTYLETYLQKIYIDPNNSPTLGRIANKIQVSPLSSNQLVLASLDYFEDSAIVVKTETIQFEKMEIALNNHYDNTATPAFALKEYGSINAPAIPPQTNTDISREEWARTTWPVDLWPHKRVTIIPPRVELTYNSNFNSTENNITTRKEHKIKLIYPKNKVENEIFFPELQFDIATLILDSSLNTVEKVRYLAKYRFNFDYITLGDNYKHTDSSSFLKKYQLFEYYEAPKNSETLTRVLDLNKIEAFNNFAHTLFKAYEIISFDNINFYIRLATEDTINTNLMLLDPTGFYTRFKFNTVSPVLPIRRSTENYWEEGVLDPLEPFKGNVIGFNHSAPRPTFGVQNIQINDLNNFENGKSNIVISVNSDSSLVPENNRFSYYVEYIPQQKIQLNYYETEYRYVIKNNSFYEIYYLNGQKIVNNNPLDAKILNNPPFNLAPINIVLKNFSNGQWLLSHLG